MLDTGEAGTRTGPPDIDLEMSILVEAKEQPPVDWRAIPRAEPKPMWGGYGFRKILVAVFALALLATTVALAYLTRSGEDGSIGNGPGEAIPAPERPADGSEPSNDRAAGGSGGDTGSDVEADIGADAELAVDTPEVTDAGTDREPAGDEDDAGSTTTAPASSTTATEAPGASSTTDPEAPSTSAPATTASTATTNPTSTPTSERPSTTPTSRPTTSPPRPTTAPTTRVTTTPTSTPTTRATTPTTRPTTAPTAAPTTAPTIPTTPTTAGPGPGAVAFGDNLYELIGTDLTWQQANAEAEARGGHLVYIDGWAENWFVRDNFAEGRAIWLGLLDSNGDGIWNRTDGSVADFTWFGVGQPDYAGSPAYARMAYDTGEWDDGGPSATTFYTGGRWVDRTTIAVVEYEGRAAAARNQAGGPNAP